MTDKMSGDPLPLHGLTCDVDVSSGTEPKRCDAPGVAISRMVTTEGPIIYPVWCGWHDQDRKLYKHLAYPTGWTHQWARVMAFRKMSGTV